MYCNNTSFNKMTYLTYLSPFTFQVMIYLIDHVLPDGYYAHNLRALSVDMAVFRDLLRVTFPKLSKHLDHLQSAAQDNTTGGAKNRKKRNPHKKTVYIYLILVFKDKFWAISRFLEKITQ